MEILVAVYLSPTPNNLAATENQWTIILQWKPATWNQYRKMVVIFSESYSEIIAVIGHGDDFLKHSTHNASELELHYVKSLFI